MNLRRLEPRLQSAVHELQRSTNRQQNLAELEDKQGKLFADEVWRRFCARRDRV